RFLEISSDVYKADSFAGLAALTGVDESGLVTTMREHNRRIADGELIDPFGRELAELPPVLEPPFYALRYYPAARKNLGGVRTDLDCRVLDNSDNAIPGLYAAGELAGMAGGRINGKYALEGTMFGPSVFSGR